MASTAGVFKEEFQRLLRALYDSLERETELQRQLRRTKESLVATALRLQVATKVAQEDERSIATLINEVATVKADAVNAKKQGKDAADIIASLNLEISALKRRVRAMEAERNAAEASLNPTNPENMKKAADAEIDEMMRQFKVSTYLPVGMTEDMRPSTPAGLMGENFDDGNNDVHDHYFQEQIHHEEQKKQHQQLSTPFQRWKMEQLLYASDNTSSEVVQEHMEIDQIMEAAALELQSDHFKKKYANRIKSTKRSSHGGKEVGNRADAQQLNRALEKMDHSRSLNSISMARNVDDVLEGLLPKVKPRGASRGFGATGRRLMGNSSGKSPLSIAQLEEKTRQKRVGNEYFNNGSLTWGNGEKFDRSNLGRVNLWSGKGSAPTAATATGGGSGGNPSPVRSQRIASV